MSQQDKTSPNSQDEFLTPSQVAELMKVGEFTVRLWLRRGLLRGFRIGKSWRIHQSALDAFRHGTAEQSR